MNAERAVFVYTTYPSLVEAERIGKAVLERRLDRRPSRKDLRRLHLLHAATAPSPPALIHSGAF